MDGKKFYIAVDCEGAACVVGSPGKGLVDSENYSFARIQVTREADAAARALFDCGAEEVVIWDNHATGINLDYDGLDSRCKIALGRGQKGRLPGLDASYDGLLFIGYHAREGSDKAVLSHTYSSKLYQEWTINGVPVGEMEVDAAFAGAVGVPVLFAASDDVALAQAFLSFPGIGYVETKKSLSWNSALSLHPQESVKRIYEEVLKTAKKTPPEPYIFQLPLELSIRFKRVDEAGEAKLYDRDRRPFIFEDAYTRKGMLDRLEDLFD